MSPADPRNDKNRVDDEARARESAKQLMDEIFRDTGDPRYISKGLGWYLIFRKGVCIAYVGDHCESLVGHPLHSRVPLEIPREEGIALYLENPKSYELKGINPRSLLKRAPRTGGSTTPGVGPPPKLSSHNRFSPLAEDSKEEEVPELPGTAGITAAASTLRSKKLRKSLAMPGHLVGEWIADTGSGHDLVQRTSVVDPESRIVKSKHKLTLNTANGLATMDERARLSVRELDEVIEPLIILSGRFVGGGPGC